MSREETTDVVLWEARRTDRAIAFYSEDPIESGEAGKLIAVLLLTLQLAAGGGVMPIELTGDFFRAVHSWLPFTWVVKAFRASLFGAFDNGWLHAWSMVAAIGGVCLVLASVLGRWKVVSQADYQPAIES